MNRARTGYCGYMTSVRVALGCLVCLACVAAWSSLALAEEASEQRHADHADEERADVAHGHGHAEHDDHGHDQPHEAAEHADAHDHALELGLATGAAYLVGEGEITAGLHLHLVATLGETAWGLGLGYERLLDEHAHNTASAVLQYRITTEWSVIAAPGVTFEDHDPGALAPAVHLETAYEFLIGDFHIGPALEVALDTEDAHVTGGLHFGLGL